ncbi:hypothetical protein EXIGLDRAFT_733926 [Exidia glandulosa HHB12029]|uniref:Uncharacterized protein n=1 Tax=Exidia glandulosa HHB12029 TaxID=1314781 RepID=A0A165KBW4_EXIGL|nr:hypothetical protein EXIGLDRAFT_733926 [Exidia glandulosa HHB12029]
MRCGVAPYTRARKKRKRSAGFRVPYAGHVPGNRYLEDSAAVDQPGDGLGSCRRR